jgi:hypothetical protein
MPVIINQFDAVAENEPRPADAATAAAPPPRIQPDMLRMPMHRLAARASRLRAH